MDICLGQFPSKWRQFTAVTAGREVVFVFFIKVDGKQRLGDKQHMFWYTTELKFL